MTPLNTRNNCRRRGASLAEGAIVLAAMLVFVFGSLECGLLAARHNALAEAARRTARAASVRGEGAGPAQLGPEMLELTADADHPLAEACRVVLPTMDPAEVHIRIEWPEGNGLDAPVTVSLNSTHTFCAPVLRQLGSVELYGNTSKAISR